MSGNVREWCCDIYDKDYYKNFKTVSNIIEIKDPHGPIFGKEHSVKGGGWKSQAIPLTNRSKEVAGSCAIDLGFRIARNLAND